MRPAALDMVQNIAHTDGTLIEVVRLLRRRIFDHLMEAVEGIGGAGCPVSSRPDSSA